MGFRSFDILGIKPLIEGDRRIDALHDGRRSGGETATPDLAGRNAGVGHRSTRGKGDMKGGFRWAALAAASLGLSYIVPAAPGSAQDATSVNPPLMPNLR